MFEKLFATMVVGSMPRPQFFREMVDRYLSDGESNQVLQNLMDRSIPYVAALQEAAGLDVISDGEWRRKSYIGVIAGSPDSSSKRSRWSHTGMVHTWDMPLRGP